MHLKIYSGLFVTFPGFQLLKSIDLLFLENASPPLWFKSSMNFFQNHSPNLFIQFVFTWTLWNTTILPSLVRVCGIAPGFRFIIRVAAVVRSQIRTWISVYNNSYGSNGQISNSTFSNEYGHFYVISGFNLIEDTSNNKDKENKWTCLTCLSGVVWVCLCGDCDAQFWQIRPLLVVVFFPR